MSHITLHKSHILLRPKPFETESLNGYLMRVAEVNGTSIDALAWALGLPRINCVIDITLIKQVAKQLHLHPDEIARISYIQQPDGTLPHKAPLNKKLNLVNSRFTKPAVCQLCLVESNSMNAFWEFRFATVCPIHKTRLLDICPECHRSILYNRRKISECQYCKFEFKNATYEYATPSAVELTQVMYHISRISKFEPPKISACGMPIAQLANDHLSAIHYALPIIRDYFIPQHITAQWPKSNKNYSRHMNIEYESVNAMSDLLSNWPNPFIDRVFWKLTRPKAWLNVRSVRAMGLHRLAHPHSPKVLQQIGQAYLSVIHLIRTNSQERELDNKLWYQINHECKLALACC